MQALNPPSMDNHFFNVKKLDYLVVTRLSLTLLVVLGVELVLLDTITFIRPELKIYLFLPA